MSGHLIAGTGPAGRRGTGTIGSVAMAVLVAGAVLAGCTHGAGGAGQTRGSTAPAGIGSTGTGGRPPDAVPSPGSSVTALPGGATKAGGVVITTAAGGRTTVVTAPAPDEPLGAVTTHPARSLDADLAAILPGAYGLASLGAQVHGSTVDLAAQGGCRFALDVIRSGQWALTPVLQPHDDVTVYLDVLSRGDRRALLFLTGSTGLCTGRIVTETEQPLSVAGTIRAAGPARAVTVRCLAQADENDGPGAHVVFVSYRTDDAALLTMVTVPDQVGRHPVDPDDQAGVVWFDPDDAALVHAATTASAFFDPTLITPEAMLPGVDVTNAWFQGAGATVTVTSTDPLTGTLDAPHLRRESGGGAAALSAGFSC